MNPRFIAIPVIVVGLLAGGYLIDRSRVAGESLMSGFFDSQPTLASSRLGGRVDRIFVKEGESVRRGEPLLVLSNKSFAASTKAAQSTAVQSKAELEETVRGARQEEIQRLKGAVREAEAAYRRLADGPLPEEISNAEANFRAAREDYRKTLAGSRPEEIASARAVAEAARAKLAVSQRGLTTEERAELAARARLAASDEENARAQLQRESTLYSEDAVARQQYDAALNAWKDALAKKDDADEQLKRAELGTPPEELAQAEQEYRQAKAQLDLAVRGSRREDIAASRDRMDAAYQSLLLVKRGSRVEDIQAAKARLDQARASLQEQLDGSRREDLQKARAASKAALDQARSSAESLAERTIYAPMDANVDRVLVADGDVLSPDVPAIQLSNPDDIWLRVYLPEEDLPKIKVNDSAQLAVDGISTPVAGIVESIADRGEFTPANLQSPEERAMQVFAVRIRLAHPDRRVRAGIFATVKRVGAWP